MKLKKLFTTLLTAIALAFGAGQANATLILTLDDGAGNSVTITDGGLNDGNPATGAVGFDGLLGNWWINWTGGVSSSTIGADSPSLDLVSLNASSNNGGNLIITLLQTGLNYANAPGQGVLSQVGGVTSGQVSFTSLFNSTAIGGFGPYGTGAFSGTAGGTVDTTGGFSLTQIAQISHTGAGLTSFNLVTTVPEPASLSLLGVGLVGLALARRRRVAATNK